VEDWLAGMDEDGILVGPNWNAELDGLEIEPIEILKQLTEDGAGEPDPAAG
jgi:hypothetical protein